MQPLLATDGAGSVMRRRMTARGLIETQEADLEHGYKELSIPRRSEWRLPNGAGRAAHLAAGRLHADRAAQCRRQLHGDVVPA